MEGARSQIRYSNDNSQTITNFDGFKASPAGAVPATVTFTQSTGFRIDDHSRAATNWAIRSFGQDSHIVGDVRIGSTVAPGFTLDVTGDAKVDQSSTTGAKPVLTLDQADISEEMVEFVTTIGTGNAIEAIGAKTLTTTHFIKVTIPGGLTRYIPVGTIA